MAKMAKKLGKLFSTALFLVSMLAIFVYGNYLKVRRPHHEVGQFKFASYGMGGRPIYLSAQDYGVLLGAGVGLASSIIALYYLQERRKN